MTTTDQKYDGKADYANQIEETAKNANLAAKNQAEPKPTYQAVSPETALLNTVSKFFRDRDTDGIVRVINELTHDWLDMVFESNADTDRDTYSKDFVMDILFTMNKVTEFIVSLQQCDSHISYSEANTIARIQDDLTGAYEEQISLLNQLAEARERTIKLLEEQV